MNLRNILIGGSLVLLLVAIPLTVFVAQQQQQTESQAQKSTTLCLTPESTTGTSTTTPICGSGPLTATAGATLKLAVIMNPGSNQVSTVRLNLVYDAAKLATTSAGITPNTTVVTPLTETVYSTGNATARLGIVVNPNVGVDPTKTLSEPTKIATIELKVLESATGTTSVAFGETLVLSSNPNDGQDEDVLSSATPLSITITAASPTPGAPVVQAPPSCTSLNVDRVTSGSAPFSITFTANGRDTDGTISKVTFDFGDGPQQDITQTGGIGTNSVSTQVAHTYNNPGTYQAKATLTDNSNAISSPSAACAQTITVAAPVGGTGDTGTPSATPIVLASPTEVPSPTITPGPEGALIGIGAVGAILAVIGGLLSFAF